jgi:hypothetical protein
MEKVQPVEEVWNTSVIAWRKGALQVPRDEKSGLVLQVEFLGASRGSSLALTQTLNVKFQAPACKPRWCALSWPWR